MRVRAINNRCSVVGEGEQAREMPHAELAEGYLCRNCGSALVVTRPDERNHHQHVECISCRDLYPLDVELRSVALWRRINDPGPEL